MSSKREHDTYGIAAGALTAVLHSVATTAQESATNSPLAPHCASPKL
jgi:hypothetical protein